MGNIKVIALIAVFVAVVVLVGAMQHQAGARLATAERLWRQQVDQVSRLTAENTRLSNILVQTRLQQTRANDQLRELLRLRSELNILRQQSNSLAQLAASAAPENPSPATPAPPPPTPVAPPQALNVVPRETWAFAGYATPEAALQTVVWAMSNGDTATYLASLTPAGWKHLQEQMEGKSESDLAAILKDEVADVKALRLDQKHDAGDGKVSFVISSNNNKEEQVVVLKNIGNEWRVVGAPDE